MCFLELKNNSNKSLSRNFGFCCFNLLRLALFGDNFFENRRHTFLFSYLPSNKIHLDYLKRFFINSSRLTFVHFCVQCLHQKFNFVFLIPCNASVDFY